MMMTCRREGRQDDKETRRREIVPRRRQDGGFPVVLRLPSSCQPVVSSSYVIFLYNHVSHPQQRILHETI